MNKLFTLLIATAALAVPACTGVFTKDDVKEVGSVILKDSLSAASSALAGDQMDWRITASQIGMKAANLALKRATENLSKEGLGLAASPEMVNAEAQRILTAALKQAQTDLPTLAADPQQAQTAQLVAASSTEKAIEALSVPDGSP